MPKSSKKKKDKAADFSKAKLKLGKGKQAPSNAVDTSFKARSIALPTQSIALDRSGEAPTTKRKLTLDDLISHLKHYNIATRRDAILGLRELLEAHPDLISQNLTALVNNCVRLIGDEDASVRKTLLSFLTWLLRQVQKEDLVPHSPVLLLFTSSAQTHIFPEIRIDALRFLDLLLELIPDVVTEGWDQGSGGHGRRVLEGYLGILSAGTTFGEGGDTGPVQATSTASVILSPGSKLIALKSLSTFLYHALSSTARNGQASSSATSSPTPTWFLSPSFSSAEAFESFESMFHSSYHNTQSTSSARLSERWTEEVDPEVYFEQFPGTFDLSKAPIGAGWALQELSNIDLRETSQSSQGSNVQSSFATHLARTLHSTLVSTFLDCAPTVFSPSSSPPETEVQMVLVVGEICRTLYGTILRDTVEAEKSRGSALEDLKQMLGYLSPYFPFAIGGSVVARRDVKIEQAFQDLNLIYCELTSFLVLASSSSDHEVRHPHHRRRKTQRPSRTHGDPSSASPSPPLQISLVSDYVVQLLRGEIAPGSSQTSLARPITPAAYCALLPTIWSLLNSPTTGNADASKTVLRVVVEHAMKASSTSAVKRSTIDFLGRLVLLEREAEYHGIFTLGRNSEEDRSLQEWILHLPKTLWELGANSLPTTETIFRLLLRLCQRRSPLLREETLSHLRARMVPYFIVTHATRGRLPGPYAKLPPASPLCRLVLDFVASIAGDGFDDGLEAAVDEAMVGTDAQYYWTSIKRRPFHVQ